MELAARRFPRRDTPTLLPLLINIRFIPSLVLGFFRVDFVVVALTNHEVDRERGREMERERDRGKGEREGKEKERERERKKRERTRVYV